MRDILRAGGGAIPTRVCTPQVAHNSWAALLMAVAEGLRRIHAAKQQHREALLDMLVKGGPYSLPQELL